MKGTRTRVTGAAAKTAACIGILLATAAPTTAGAGREGGWSLEVLVNGAPVPEYASRGTTYVEALAGREYSIRLSNHTADRVAIALSVDGLNSIDARSTTTRAASKWILDPYRTITIDGWQTGPATARRFFFTTEERSYGAWLGDTRNLGIITAAVFRERKSLPAPIVRDGAAPAAPGSEGKLRLKAGRGGAREERSGPGEADSFAATGIGGELDHRVTRVAFESENEPVVVLNIRYEYRDALVRLGVLPRPHPPCEDPLARREDAAGFEGMTFAPDPFRRRCP